MISSLIHLVLVANLMICTAGKHGGKSRELNGNACSDKYPYQNTVPRLAEFVELVPELGNGAHICAMTPKKLCSVWCPCWCQAHLNRCRFKMSVESRQRHSSGRVLHSFCVAKTNALSASVDFWLPRIALRRKCMMILDYMMMTLIKIVNELSFLCSSEFFFIIQV